MRPRPPPRIEVRDASPRSWPLLEELFGSNGACGGCWCMHWRVRGVRAWEECKGAGNRRAFRELVEAGEARGCIALADGKPVGWCSLGPKVSFERLAASRVLATAAPEGTWSVVCFFVPAEWRGRGVATKLLEGAVRQAQELGAKRLEGYPVKVDAGRRYAATFAFVGVPALFENAGFTAAADRPGARPVYALELGRRGATGPTKPARSRRRSPSSTSRSTRAPSRARGSSSSA